MIDVKRSSTCVCLFWLLISFHASAIAQSKVDVLVKDITVFDAGSGKIIPHRDIVISDTRIREVIPTGRYSGTAKTTINGHGKFAVPGFFDNHVHMARLKPATAGLFLVYGITSVRDMGTDPAKIREWRKAIAYGKFMGPRIVHACGPMLEVRGEERIDHWVVKDPAHAEEVVARVAAAGMECVKMRTFSDEETYRAIAAAAEKHGLMFVGHAPEQFAPRVAIEAGQRTFEHAFYPYPLSKLSETEKKDLFRSFSAADVALVPTFIAWQWFTQQPDELETKLAHYRKAEDYRLPPELLAHWERNIEVHRQQKRGSPGWRSAVATSMKDVGEMHAAGITVLPGSDTGAPFVVPGLSLHEEFELLVREVGMRPADVLRAATLLSARLYGKETDLGSIEAGKIADLVILNSDPLQDIGNTRDIDSVVFRGEALTRAHLNILRGNTKKSRPPEQK